MNAKKLVPLSGILAVLLIIASFVITGDTPDTDASGATVQSFYAEHDSDAMIDALVLGLGAFFMVWFTISVAGAIRKAGNAETAATVAIVGGGMFALGLAIFASISFALGDVGNDIDPAAAQALNVLSEDFFFPLAIGLGVFGVGAGVGIVKTGALPKWLGWIAIVIGIAALTPAGWFGFLLFGLWTIVASVMLSMRAETA